MKITTKKQKTRLRILMAVLVVSALFFAIYKTMERNAALDKPKRLTMYTTAQSFFLNEFALQKYIDNAFHLADANAARKVMHHYRLSRGHIHGTTGTRWLYIAAKLGHPASLREWKMQKHQSCIVFALASADGKSKAMDIDEYSHYVRFMSALVHHDETEAMVHLNRLRELGVTEKLLENPLVLPGMEDAP